LNLPSAKGVMPPKSQIFEKSQYHAKTVEQIATKFDVIRAR